MADPTGATEAPAPSGAQPAVATADPQASASPGAWERIKEHKILQWGLGYFGAAIAIAHGQELMAEAFEWPHVIGRILMSVLVLGFPLVLTLAWYHGHKGLKKVGAGELAILSALTLIAAGLLVLFVRVPNEQVKTGASLTEQQSLAPAEQLAVRAPEG